MKTCASTLFALIVLLSSRGAPLRSADHRDAPAISEDGRADLLDVFAFVNPNNGRIVLAATVNPFAIGGALAVAFAPDVLYEFKIDNTGDNVEDLVIQTTFTPTVPGPQAFTVRGPARPRITGARRCSSRTRHRRPARRPGSSSPAAETCLAPSRGCATIRSSSI